MLVEKQLKVSVDLNLSSSTLCKKERTEHTKTSCCLRIWRARFQKLNTLFGSLAWSSTLYSSSSFTLIHGVPVVKPACLDLFHYQRTAIGGLDIGMTARLTCIGVLALSRAFFWQLAMMSDMSTLSASLPEALLLCSNVLKLHTDISNIAVFAACLVAHLLPPEIDGRNILVFLHRPAFWDVSHADFLPLVHEQRTAERDLKDA